jgi:hypothetical protein
MHPLSEYGLSSGLTDNVIKKLSDEVTIEIARLGIFNSFSCEANWSI